MIGKKVVSYSVLMVGRARQRVPAAATRDAGIVLGTQQYDGQASAVPPVLQPGVGRCRTP